MFISKFAHALNALNCITWKVYKSSWNFCTVPLYILPSKIKRIFFLNRLRVVIKKVLFLLALNFGNFLEEDIRSPPPLNPDFVVRKFFNFFFENGFFRSPKMIIRKNFFQKNSFSPFFSPLKKNKWKKSPFFRVGHETKLVHFGLKWKDLKRFLKNL